MDHRTALKITLLGLLGFVFLLTPLTATAQFTYITNNGAITITGYTGPGGAVVIPATINNWPVTAIGDYAFADKTALTAVTIPATVASIGENAFLSCINLRAFNVHAANAWYSSLDGVLFNQEMTTLI